MFAEIYVEPSSKEDASRKIRAKIHCVTKKISQITRLKYENILQLSTACQHTCLSWRVQRYVFGVSPGTDTVLQVEKSRVQFPIVSFEFFIDIIFPAALWPWS
jgi:hypothetical protein